MRTLLKSLERRFESLHTRSVGMLRRFPEDDLFLTAFSSAEYPEGFSFGTSLIRSAAEVERVFGGITTRLWDDPFEWTLPEKLSTKTAIFEYLSEVESIRKKGFAALADDEALSKMIPAPEDLRSILDILLEALCKAEEKCGRTGALILMKYTTTTRDHHS